MMEVVYYPLDSDIPLPEADVVLPVKVQFTLREALKFCAECVELIYN